MSRTRPTWPGARWWKFDFHTHTPASKDTTAWRNAEETPDAVTPEKWLLKFMEAEIDCVAITDHNSGSWIDELKSEYEKMKGDADRGAALPGFRELTLFPGVEISAAGGIHILAILDPSATKSDVDTLLGSVGFHGTKGDSDAVTTKGLVEVLRLILQQGGIPIPAPADRVKGLLERDEGAKGKVDSQTLQQALDVEGLFAVEWCSDGALPSCFGALVSRLTRVLGSDCHSFRDGSAPGKNFTWVKMARPSLEGLRLALLDGHELLVVTHNPNVVVNGDAELVHVMDFRKGQCFVQQSGALQEEGVRQEVCRVMEGGREAFTKRWWRLGGAV